MIADSPSADLPSAPVQATGQAHGALEQLGTGEDIRKLRRSPMDKVIGGFTGNGLVADGAFMPMH